MTQKKKLIERCNDFLSDEQQKGLANSFGRKSTAIELYSQLEPIYSRSDVEELVLLIKLAKLAGFRRKVVSHCLLLDKVIKKRKYFGIQERGKALCLDGDLEGGLKLLQSIPSERRTQHVNRVISSAEVSLDRVAAGKRVRSIIRKNKKVAVADEQAGSAIDAVARCSEGVDLRLSLSRIVGLKGGSHIEDPGGPSSTARPIFCSGFGWSGSGAVFDFLSDCAPSAFSLCSPIEFRLLRSGRYGLPKLLRTADSTADRKMAVLREFVLKGFLGLPDGTEAPLEVRQIAEKSVLGSLGADLDPSFYQKLDGALLSFMNVYLSADFVSFDVRDAFIKLFSTVMSPFYSETGKPLLLNNAILAKRPEAASFFEGMRMVGVIRDPRDIYTTRVVQAGWGHSVERFVDLLEDGLARFSDFENSKSSDVRLVRFEEFVLDADVRSDLLRWLGVEGAIRTGSLFDETQSAKNIGIHKRFADQKAIEVIERAFPELCETP